MMSSFFNISTIIGNSNITPKLIEVMKINEINWLRLHRFAISALVAISEKKDKTIFSNKQENKTPTMKNNIIKGIAILIIFFSSEFNAGLVNPTKWYNIIGIVKAIEK